ncbi:hypothetical protein [Microbacterium sp. SORGH_AS_0888]|uniref:hypothetical protein n=1 Tax=Microbacterium sp. SORGH_AS_0888 TaxID=3041791 RepID=UPI00278A9BB3|nr:hypothetical protein [Microbacterium sp. SORGH_AS_0888]MDQ1127901.1 hypothetical protein [Microbacterium sp. SORGH_AS_0888]
MPRRIPLPHEVHARAFTVGEGMRLGLGPGRLRGRDLQHPFHGVRAAGVDLDVLSARCAALGLLLADRHAISHATAAALFGAPLPSPFTAPQRPLEVTSLGGGRMRRVGVRAHEGPPDLPVVRSPWGFLVVAPATAWCQLAADAVSRRGLLTHADLVAVADAFVSGRRAYGDRRTDIRCTVSDLAAAAEQHGSRRGAVALARALPHVREGVDSPRETLLRLTIVGAGLPEPEIGLRVVTADGTFFLDLAYRDARIDLEYEGDHHRSDAQQWRHDIRRVRALQEAGWLVLRVTAGDLASGPARAALVSQLRRHLASRR